MIRSQREHHQGLANCLRCCTCSYLEMWSIGAPLKEEDPTHATHMTGAAKTTRVSGLCGQRIGGCCLNEKISQTLCSIYACKKPAHAFMGVQLSHGILHPAEFGIAHEAVYCSQSCQYCSRRGKQLSHVVVVSAQLQVWVILQRYYL